MCWTNHATLFILIILCEIYFANRTFIEIFSKSLKNTLEKNFSIMHYSNHNQLIMGLMTVEVSGRDCRVCFNFYIGKGGQPSGHQGECKCHSTSKLGYLWAGFLPGAK